MSDERKEFLEWNDLARLHMQFGEDEENRLEICGRDMPKVENQAREDVWSNAVLAASSDQVSEMRSVYAKISHSDVSMDGKYWWDAILTIGMNAPLEDLERILKKKGMTQSDQKADYIRIAAWKFAEHAAKQEQKIREMQKQEEKARLLKLQEEACRRQQEKEMAENQLKQHRESQGNGR